MIKNIHIKNFKSIREANIIMSDFSVIAGLNGAGKTNLIQAISLLKDLVSGESIDRASRKIALSPNEIFNRNDSSKEVTLRINLVNKKEEEYLLEVIFGLSGKKDGLSFEINSEKLERVELNNKTIIYTRIKDRIENGSKKPIPLSVEESKLVISLYLDQDARAVKNFFGYIHIPDSTYIDSRESIVVEGTSSLAGLLIKLKNKNPENYEKFQKIVSKLIPSFSSIADLESIEVHKKIPSNSEEDKHYLVLIEEKNLKGRLSMRSLSTGDIRTSFIIACALAIRDGSVIIIEEIENGIHPKRVKDLIEFLEKIANIRDLQIIFTTHSTAIINSVKVKNIIYAEKKGEQGTHFLSFNETEKQNMIKDLLEEGGEMIDYINHRSN